MAEFLPDLGALAAAGFLLLIAGALWVLQGLLTNTLGRVPVIGSWISSNLNAALNDARNAVLSGATSSWGAAIQLFRWAEDFARNPVAAVIGAFAQVYNFGRRVVDVYLPGAENYVLNSAAGWFSSAENYALSLVRTAENDATVLVDDALSTAAGWVAVAEHDTAAAFSTAETDITRAFDTAVTDAASLVTNASTALAADIRAAEALAASEVGGLEASVQSAIDALANGITSGIASAEAIAASRLAAVQGGIYTDLETWGDQAVTEAWPDAAGEIDALRNTLGADFPWLRDLLPELAGAGALGLAGALIRSMATSQAVTRLANDCIVPNCRNLSGLGNDLSNLLGTASTAAMLAWLVFAVTDPGGWSSEMVTVAAPAAATLANDAARLFSGG